MTSSPTIRVQGQQGNDPVECLVCGATFDSERGLRVHVARKGPDHDCHGTLAEYRRGCRCLDCRRAESVRAYRSRDNQRIKQLEELPKTPLGCLVASGFSADEIGSALAAYSAYELHWAAWRRSGVFRQHCRCDVPNEVLNSLEEAS